MEHGMGNPHSNSNPFIIAIEGNIGSGKTTALQYISELLSPQVEICPEPVNKWQHCNGFNLLELIQITPKRYLFQFQNYVQLTRAQSILKPSDKPIKLVERSLQSSQYCFVQVAQKNGYLTDSEFYILNEWNAWMSTFQNIGPDLIIYLKSHPAVSLKRMKIRNRPEEKKIKIDYLQSLHDAYEDWLFKGVFGDPPAPVIIIDANQTIDELKDQFSGIKDILTGQRRDHQKIIHYAHEVTNTNIKQNKTTKGGLKDHVKVLKWIVSIGLKGFKYLTSIIFIILLGLSGLIALELLHFILQFGPVGFLTLLFLFGLDGVLGIIGLVRLLGILGVRRAVGFLGLVAMAGFMALIWNQGP